MTVIARPWHGDDSETRGSRRKGGRPKGSNNKKDKAALAEPELRVSVLGIGIPMPTVAVFNDLPSEAMVESFTETYWDEKAWRPVLGKLTAVRYIELWDANLFVFQRDKRGKVLNSNPDWPWAKLEEAKRQLKG